jgi:hypothetical protein
MAVQPDLVGLVEAGGLAMVAYGPGFAVVRERGIPPQLLDVPGSDRGGVRNDRALYPVVDADEHDADVDQTTPAHRLHPNTITAVPTFSGRSN